MSLINPVISSATGQPGLGLPQGLGQGLSLGQNVGGGVLNLNQTQTSTGLRLGLGTGLGQAGGLGNTQGRPTSLGINTSAAGRGIGQLGRGIGTGLGATGGIGTSLGGIGAGLGTTGGMGTGLGTTGGIGTGLGTTGGIGTGLGGIGTGLGTTGGIGTALGTIGGIGTGLGTTGIGTGLGTISGIGTGLGTTGGLGTGLGTTGIGTGLGAGGLGRGTGLGTTGLGTTGGIGTGLGTTGGIGTGLGTTGGIGTSLGTTGGIGTGLGTTGGIGTGLGAGGLGRGTGLGFGGIGSGTLGGLSLAGTQKGPTQGIFSQSSGMNQDAGHQQLINAQLMLSAITMPALFGDERDVIIKKFNQLEAYCGYGNGLTSYGGQPQLVVFTPDNPFARFKTICYSKLPTAKNEDGLVALHFKKSDTELLKTKDALTKSLQDIVANNSVQVVIESIKPLPDAHSEVTLYILEQSTLGSLRRVLATNTYVHLQNATRKTQLESIGVTNIYPKTGFSEDELKLYLATPPAGITNEIWEQCKKENPDPQNYIPVAVVGSLQLLDRIKYQEQEVKQHNMRLKIMHDDLNELQHQQLTTVARLAEYRRKLNDLSHRILKVMVTQERLRKFGWSLQPIEEQLRIKLEAILRELESPTLLKGKLNEIMSQLRMQTHHSSITHSNTKQKLERELAEDIKDHLTQQQGALSEMIKIIKSDFEDLKTIENGLSEMAGQ